MIMVFVVKRIGECETSELWSETKFRVDIDQPWKHQCTCFWSSWTISSADILAKVENLCREQNWHKTSVRMLYTFTGLFLQNSIHVTFPLIAGVLLISASWKLAWKTWRPRKGCSTSLKPCHAVTAMQSTRHHFVLPSLGLKRVRSPL